MWKTLKNEVKSLFSDENIYNKLVDIIKSNINPIAFSTWFSEFNFLETIGHKAIFSTNLEYTKEYIIKKYDKIIKLAVTEVSMGQITDYDIIIKEEKSPSFLDRFDYKEETTLIKKYTFENFIIGESNRFAHAASLAVSERPAQSYNPLFIYGGVGLGKTHLVHAIGNRIKSNNPSKKVLYTSAETFTNEFIDSVMEGSKNSSKRDNNTINSFRDKFRNTDILIIDDIQFFSGKERVVEEFFHTFNHLHNNEKQIILTADRPPKDISKLDDRIRSRFEWGLMCDITPPDIETRIAILKKKCEEEDILLSDEIIEYIASKIKSNIRELEGIIIRLEALTKLSNVKLNQTIVEEMVKTIVGDQKKARPQIETVIVETASYFNIDPKLLKSNSRKKDISLARQVAMYIARNVLEMSLNKIGEEFGGKDHSTVLYAINKIEEDKKTDTFIENVINEVTEIIIN